MPGIDQGPLEMGTDGGYLVTRHLGRQPARKIRNAERLDWAAPGSSTSVRARRQTQALLHRVREPGAGPEESVEAIPKEGNDREQQDLEVEPQRPVVDVVVVPLDPVSERGAAAQAVHLRPAGDARLDAVAGVVAVDRLAERRCDVIALRPRADERHLTPEDIQELRKLVQ